MSKEFNVLNLKKPVFAFFPKEIIELNKEISNHPALQKLLSNQPSNELEIRVAEIAAYCKIGVDAHFSREEFVKLCGMCLNELRKKRGMPIVSSDAIAGSDGLGSKIITEIKP